jgi:hypothetical protein
LKFELRDGGHTEVHFYRDVEGKTHPFPEANASLVWEKGTDKSKENLERILTSGVEALSDRVYVAYMGPPIPPYKVRCYCGHIITVGHDQRGYYIEGAQEIIFEPGEKGPPT